MGQVARHGGVCGRVRQVLDECANDAAGMRAEERPIIGVRGQRKDLARVARLIAVRGAACADQATAHGAAARHGWRRSTPP